MPRIYYKRIKTFCSVTGCIDAEKYGGMCGKHYKRKWRHGNTETVITPINFERKVCAVDNCDNLTYASNTDYCKLHYQRLRRYNRLENIKAEYGSGSINTSGYRVFTINYERVYEHTLLAELALGKPLPNKVVVHHMNNNPSDNYTPFNLIICPNQAYHLLLHRRAKELGYFQEKYKNPNLVVDIEL